MLASSTSAAGKLSGRPPGSAAGLAAVAATAADWSPAWLRFDIAA